MNHISLKPYNTFGIDVKANDIKIVNSIEEAKSAFKSIHQDHEQHLILGGGSNVLFTSDFNGVIVLNRICGIEIIEDSNTSTTLKVGAGENWHSFVEYAISKNLGGIENLSLIPGCVGASPMQNIGAYGVEVKDVITNVYALDIQTLEEVVFTNNECKFDYRSSIFKTSHKGRYLISHVAFKLSKKHRFNIKYGAIKSELDKNGIHEDELNLKAISDAVINIRESKLPNPKDIGNAGSFFKNPVVDNAQFESLISLNPTMPHYRVDYGVKLAAGWLIEKAGWKGYRNNNYGVHSKQALVLVNYEDADGQSIFELSQRIIEDIKSKFNIDLEREVNII